MHVVLCVSVSFILLLQAHRCCNAASISVYVTCIVYGHMYICVPLLHWYCKGTTRCAKYLVMLFDFMEYHFHPGPEIKKALSHYAGLISHLTKSNFVIVVSLCLFPD